MSDVAGRYCTVQSRCVHVAEKARSSPAAVRTSSGGLPCVKAIGVQLAERGIVQVSMNLTDYAVTSMPRVFERVRELATEGGVKVLESEVIGLVPAGAFGDATPASLALRDFRPDQILEHRIRNLEVKSKKGEVVRSPFDF